MNFEKPMTPREVSVEFFAGELSYTAVLAMARSGELPFRKIRGKYLIWPSELTKWKEVRAS
ncbi:hypothetical protein [Pectinatus frisingensis]|uniref:hypothetical protein n=1 Tax=Pectinatus frisingensis TaxID=865 RepID=UPI0018C7C49B|nr:hypothetical protein [Pectinatus frisingensis]